MVQLVCPKCRHEFQYDNGYYDREIARLGIEIKDIIDQRAAHKLKPWPEQNANTNWWLRSRKALSEKQKQLAELKAFRKIADQQRSRQESLAFRHAVRERCGEEIYQKCLADMIETVKAYDVASLAKHEYSHKGPSVTSISKL